MVNTYDVFQPIDSNIEKLIDEMRLEDAESLCQEMTFEGEEGEDAAACGDVTEIVSLAGPISAHIKALGDANWKERQAAIAAIDEIVTKAKPLGCTGPYMEGACGELWGAMKARLKDINKNLAIQVVALLGKIAAAVGAPVEKYAKFVKSGPGRWNHLDSLEIGNNGSFAFLKQQVPRSNGLVKEL